MALTSSSKVLVGVTYCSPKELASVRRLLDQHKPASVGLGIRADWEKEKYPRLDLMSDLHDQLRGEGKRVILLEDPAADDQMVSVLVLRSMHHGAKRVEDLQAEIAYLTHKLDSMRGFLPPERGLELATRAVRLEAAIRLHAEIPDPDAVETRFRILNGLRVVYLTGQIQRAELDMAVVMSRLAEHVHPKLTGYELQIFEEQ